MYTESTMQVPHADWENQAKRFECFEAVSRKIFWTVREYCQLHAGKLMTFYLYQPEIGNPDEFGYCTLAQKVIVGFLEIKDCAEEDYLYVVNSESYPRLAGSFIVLPDPIRKESLQLLAVPDLPNWFRCIKRMPLKQDD